MNMASKSVGNALAGLWRWLEGLAAQTFHNASCYLANAFLPVRFSSLTAQHLTGVAVRSVVTAPPSFPFCKINNIHGLGLPAVCFIVAGDEHRRGQIGNVTKRNWQGA